MKKRITIITLTLNYGGIEKYISSLCKMLHNSYDIDIISVYKETEKPVFNYYESNIKYLIGSSYSQKSLRELLNNKNIKDFILEIKNRLKIKILEKKLLEKEIRKINSNYVITTRIKHNKLVNKLLKNNKIIKIATEHNSYDINSNYDKKLCRSVSNFNYLVLVSKIQFEHYKNMYKRCIYIPNTIDEISNEKSKLDNLNLISVGRLSPEKGFLDLVKVLKIVVEKNKNVKLSIAGDGFFKKEIENLIKENKLSNNIFLLGNKSQDELKKLYLDSSLYVMTSYSESFGIVLLEANSYGVPCIAFSSAKGAKEVLTEFDQYLIDDRNIEKMANTILKLLENKNELKEKAKSSYNIIKKYSNLEVKKMWDDLLK